MIELYMFENDHDVRSNVYGLTMSDQLLNIIPVKAHRKSQKSSAAHTFNIVLRITPGLTSCKDLATVVDISPDNN